MTDDLVLTDENTNRLVHELGYRESVARTTLGQIDRLAPDLRGAFARWLRDGELEGPTVMGYDIGFLVNSLGQKPPGAYVALGWLRGEFPDLVPAAQAKRVLDRVALRRGIQPPSC